MVITGFQTVNGCIYNVNWVTMTISCADNGTVFYFRSLDCVIGYCAVFYLMPTGQIQTDTPVVSVW